MGTYTLENNFSPLSNVKNKETQIKEPSEASEAGTLVPARTVTSEVGKISDGPKRESVETAVAHVSTDSSCITYRQLSDKDSQTLTDFIHSCPSVHYFSKVKDPLQAFEVKLFSLGDNLFILTAMQQILMIKRLFNRNHLSRR